MSREIGPLVKSLIEKQACMSMGRERWLIFCLCFIDIDIIIIIFIHKKECSNKGNIYNYFTSIDFHGIRTESD